MHKTPQKDTKDAKVSQRPIAVSLPSQSAVLPPSLLRTGSARAPLIAAAASMADEPVTPPTPPSPSDGKKQSGLLPLGIPKDVEISKFLRDLKTVDTSDVKTRAAIEKAAAYGLSATNGGFEPVVKHKYGLSVNTALWNINSGTAAAADITAFVPGTNPGFSLNGYIFSGDNYNQRLGRRIRGKHLSFKMDMVWSAAGISNGGGVTTLGALAEGMAPVRVTMFRDRFPLASLPLNYPAGATSNDANSLYFSLQTSASVQNASIAPFNPTTHGYRYDILYDKVIDATGASFGYSFSSGIATPGAGILCCRKIHDIQMPLHGHTFEYGDDATTTATTCIDGEIFVMFAQDSAGGSQAAAVNIPCYFDFQYDLTFIDN